MGFLFITSALILAVIHNAKTKKNNMINKFEIAPKDKTAKYMSHPITIILGIVTIGFYWFFPFLFSPRGYRILSDAIIIQTPVTSYKIPKGEIKSIDLVKFAKPGVGFTWLGGHFGYAGQFSLPDGSAAIVYATRWDHMVRITTISGEPYLLSPAEPESFLESAKKIILQNDD